eukprot:COSAG02_NODE_24790_length_677_cov_1.493080_1_plen_22_part_10
MGVICVRAMLVWLALAGRPAAT